MLGQAEAYLRGLAQAGKRNMERMAEAVPDTNSQKLQNFLTNSPWDHRAVIRQVAQEADKHLGGQDDTCLLIDESSFPKKGTESVGVARQWSGRLGKVDNCQTGVFATLCLGARHVLIDVRLYLPKDWIGDPARCRRAGVPANEIVARSKSEHALLMVAEARARSVRFAWVGVDGGYGKEPAFLRALDDAKEVFVADVHSTQRVWTEDPGLHVPPPEPGRGRPAKKQQASVEPVTVEALVKAFSASDWTRCVLRESTRGPLQVDIAHRRVFVWDREEATPRCWHLIVRREVGSPTTIKYSLSNAPAETTPPRLAQMQGQRYWVERSLQDAKGACGMADYQARLWPAWHHHMAMVMIAMLFMAEERTLQSDHEDLLSCADIVGLLKHFLPQAAVTREQVIEQMHQRHRQRRAATRSASRAQERQME